MHTISATTLFLFSAPVLATDMRGDYMGTLYHSKNSFVDQIVGTLFSQTLKVFLSRPADLGNLTIGMPSDLTRPARSTMFRSTAGFCSVTSQRSGGKKTSLLEDPRVAQTEHQNEKPLAAVVVRAGPGDEVAGNKDKYAAMQDQLGVVRTAAAVGFGARGRGLFASRSLGALVVGGLERGAGGDKKKGETVLDMPLEGNALCVAANTDPTAVDFASAQHLRAQVPAPLAAFATRPDVPPAVRLAVLLHWEQREGLYKNYYADTLPSKDEYASALLLPSEILPEFQDAKLEREVKEARADAESFYANLVLKDEQLQAEPTLIPELRDFLLALTHVQTRAFNGEIGANGVLGLMVPFCDLINHEFDPNCNFELLSEERYFKIQTRKSVPLDTELCISYGEDLDNYRLQVTYGFNLPGNKNDRVNLPFEYVMGWMGKPLTGASAYKRTVIDPDPLSTATDRLRGVAEDGAAEMRTFAAKSELETTRWPGTSSSAEAAGAAALAYQAYLKSFATTIDEDKEILKRYAGEFGPFAAAVRFRLERKLLVKAALDLAIATEEASTA